MEVVTASVSVEDVDQFLEDLAAVGDDHDCAIQAFDARYVADRDHLRRAVELADRSIDRGENVARDRAMEIMLYAAGRRQIDRAIEMGVEGDGGEAVVVVAADPAVTDPPATPREVAAAAAVEALPGIDPGPVDWGDPEVLREFFSVPDAELAATDADLSDLVRERVALLEVEK